ncbi:hypothetical protein B0H10DRAFT_1961038 [Mycena sp. CBHHK59/15]|nr:hypothetical protein B0H10DRAFT_1961038 [Mycena sp. CBHHK59/15]
MTPTSELPSASSLLYNSQQTTEKWYKSPQTKKGYGNYVKSSKKWLVDWTAKGCLHNEISADAFDNITAQTPLALRALTAYKCEHWSGDLHLQRAFVPLSRTTLNSTATQALPMLPADLKIIMEYLDSEEAIKYFTLTKRLYFKVFITTTFTLWTRTYFANGQKW